MNSVVVFSCCNLLENILAGHRITFNYGSSEISELWYTFFTYYFLDSCVTSVLNVSKVMVYYH